MLKKIFLGIVWFGVFALTIPPGLAAIEGFVLGIAHSAEAPGILQNEVRGIASYTTGLGVLVALLLAIVGTALGNLPGTKIKLPKSHAEQAKVTPTGVMSPVHIQLFGRPIEAIGQTIRPSRTDSATKSKAYLAYFIVFALLGATLDFFATGLVVYFGPLFLLITLLGGVFIRGAKYRFAFGGGVVGSLIGLLFAIAYYNVAQISQRTAKPLGPTHFHIIPDGGDAEIANSIGSLIASSYGKFDDRRKAESAIGGQIYYVEPSASGNPEVTLYQISSTEDIAAVESAARSALAATPGATSIKLIFFERQNINCVGGSGCTRGPEKMIKVVRIER